MLMVEFMTYPIEEPAKIKPSPANFIPVRFRNASHEPGSSKYKAFWMPDQVRRDDFGF
jgi:hypothetical protein